VPGLLLVKLPAQSLKARHIIPFAATAVRGLVVGAGILVSLALSLCLHYRRHGQRHLVVIVIAMLHH
jgi:hypothetical protein